MKRFIVLASVCGLALVATWPAQADHAWAPLASMQVATEGHCSAVIGNNIYTAYGYSVGDSSVLKIYDINTDTWSFGPSSPALGRSEMYRGVAHDGKLYCVGGRTN